MVGKITIWEDRVPRLGLLTAWQLRRIEQFVADNIATVIRSRDLANLTGLSHGYFCQVFRHTTGETPLTYVIRCRVEHAQALMRATDRPLAEIALDCGLADQAYLTRLFQRRLGMPPATWRRSQ